VYFFVVPADFFVIPTYFFVIPAKAGIYVVDGMDTRLRGYDKRGFVDATGSTRIT
jgi:hypothetical protein